VEEGTRVGVTGTPAFFINGRLVSGAQPLERFVRVIEEELARAQ
jgi:protein-disulfide isomerase